MSYEYLISAVVSAVVALVGYYLGRRKNEAEIKKLLADASKGEAERTNILIDSSTDAVKLMKQITEEIKMSTEEEIRKLKEENEKLKKRIAQLEKSIKLLREQIISLGYEPIKEENGKG